MGGSETSSETSMGGSETSIGSGEENGGGGARPQQLAHPGHSAVTGAAV